MALGRNLKILLFDKRITQRELANTVGCSEQMISETVTGNKIPSLRLLMKISETLGVTMDELVR